MDAASTLVAIAGAFLLAGFVKGVIGLGLPTILIGLLGLLMTPAQAAAVLASPSIVALVATLIGVGLGQLARGKIKAETFRLCFFVGLMFLGLHLALRGLL